MHVGGGVWGRTTSQKSVECGELVLVLGCSGVRCPVRGQRAGGQRAAGARVLVLVLVEVRRATSACYDCGDIAAVRHTDKARPPAAGSAYAYGYGTYARPEAPRTPPNAARWPRYTRHQTPGRHTRHITAHARRSRHTGDTSTSKKSAKYVTFFSLTTLTTTLSMTSTST